MKKLQRKDSDPPSYVGPESNCKAVKYCHAKKRPVSHNESEKEEKARVIKVLNEVFSGIVEHNDKMIEEGKLRNVLTKFDANRKPAISILHYLERIAKYAPCSSQCFILALIYIDRIVDGKRRRRSSSSAGIVLTSLNVHRLFITAVLIAAKYFDDKYYKNQFYARVGGVPNDELNALELEFLFLLDFELYADYREYDKYKLQMLGTCGVFDSDSTSRMRDLFIGPEPSKKAFRCLSFIRSISMPDRLDACSDSSQSPVTGRSVSRENSEEGERDYYADNSGNPWTSIPNLKKGKSNERVGLIEKVKDLADGVNDKENPMKHIRELCSLMIQLEVDEKSISDGSKKNLIKRALELCQESLKSSKCCECLQVKSPTQGSTEKRTELLECPKCKLPKKGFQTAPLTRTSSGELKRVPPFTVESLKRICEILVDENTCLSPGFVSRSMKGISKQNIVMLT